MPAPTWFYEYDWSLARDRIRRLVQDTDPNDKLVYDQEIAAEVSEDGDAQSKAQDYLSASNVARSLSIKFAKGVPSISSGDDSVNFGDPIKRAEFFDKLADKLAKGPVASSPRPFLGGASISQKQTTESNSDRVVPAFVRARNDPYERSELLGDWP